MKKPKTKTDDRGPEDQRGVVSQDPEMKTFNEGLRLILSVSKADLDRAAETNKSGGKSPKRS